MSTVHIDTLQEVFDIVAEAMLSYTKVPDGVSFGRDPLKRYDYRAQIMTERPYRSPVGIIAHRFGDVYLDEMLEVSTTTASDIIDELERTELRRLVYLDTSDSMKYMNNADRVQLHLDLLTMIRQFEEVYASGKSPASWAEAFVGIAKHHFLRWDRQFIARKLIEPSKSEEPKTDRAQEILDQLRGRRQANVAKEQEMSRFQEALDHIGSTDRVVEAPVTTLPLPGDKPKKADLFFDNLGGYFTFVTELPNPTLKYGQLTKKEVIYSEHNLDGDVYYVFEVIDERGYIEPVRVLNLEKAIVCKGDQIHYKDFNKVVKTMLARLQK